MWINNDRLNHLSYRVMQNKKPIIRAYIFTYKHVPRFLAAKLDEHGLASFWIWIGSRTQDPSKHGDFRILLTCPSVDIKDNQIHQMIEYDQIMMESWFKFKYDSYIYISYIYFIIFTMIYTYSCFQLKTSDGLLKHSLCFCGRLGALHSRFPTLLLRQQLHVFASESDSPRIVEHQLICNYLNS